MGNYKKEEVNNGVNRENPVYDLHRLGGEQGMRIF